MKNIYSTFKHKSKLISIILFSCFILTGCPLDGDNGKVGTDGTDGIDGIDGIDGVDGINCWDINSNRTNDPEEDINSDGTWNTDDCTTQTKVTQNPSVEFNHQHICEAFANLGQYPEGCPSTSHTKPAGELKQITGMLQDGTGNKAFSCNYPPNNGSLSVEERNGQFHWVLEGSFIANTQVITFEDELDEDLGNSCLDICKSDPDCVASLALSRQPVGNIVYDCHIFHSSDTVDPLERFCSNLIDDCILSSGVLLAAQRWGLTCP
jgi:hypothetical protein